jgi:hypothetical protein
MDYGSSYEKNLMTSKFYYSGPLLYHTELNKEDINNLKKLCLKDESDLSREESDCLKESDYLKDNYSIENNVNESGSSSELEIITIESGNSNE